MLTDQEIAALPPEDVERVVEADRRIRRAQRHTAFGIGGPVRVLTPQELRALPKPEYRQYLQATMRAMRQASR